jgi:pimeloyl-ACP methyl ester carboxylesterase
MSSVRKIHLSIPEDELNALRHRLRTTRWPEAETVADWSQGVPLARMRALIDYWASTYEWRRCEAMLNRFGLYATEIDGLVIQFLHVRSQRSPSLPLLLTHGWPGSIIEFHRVIDPLVSGADGQPEHSGGNPEKRQRRDAGQPAFDLVVPCLPGYGFSQKPAQSGWSADRTARAWITLMTRLGYARYVAQGGDWGSAITIAMGKLAPPQLAGIHLNMPLVIPRTAERGEPNAEEQAALRALDLYTRTEAAYAVLQATRPQTIGYGLADSPVAQAAWIYEKFHAWSDCNGDADSLFTREALLDNIMLYWLTNTGASSGRLYWESFRKAFGPTVLELPVGCSIFPKEIVPAPRRWADRFYRNIIHWNELDRGGHFAAFEQPELFVQELRQCFSRLA